MEFMEYPILAYGTVTEWSAGMARVQLQSYDNIVTDFLQIVKMKSINGNDVNWPLESGELVAVVVDRWCKTGVILGALSNNVDAADAEAAGGKYRQKFSDGTYFEYDASGHTYKIIPGAAATVTIQDGDGGEFKLSGGKMSFKNGGTDLKTILNNILSHIQALTVSTGTGPSSVPVNIADFINDNTNVNSLLA